MNQNSELVPRYGPEHLFGVGEVRAESGEVRASMMTGRWLRGQDGRRSAAGLGVLLADVLGGVIVNARPAGLWVATTSLSVEVLGPLPEDGQTVQASAGPVMLDDGGGLAHIAVRDASGQLLTTGAGWFRYVTGSPEAGRAPAELPDVTDRGRSLSDLLQIAFADGTLRLPPRASLVNPAGAVHAGVLFCLAVMSAEDVLRDSGLDIAGSKIDYVRPATGELRLEAVPVHRGRSLAIVRVEVRNAAGALCTVVTVSARSTAGPPAPLSGGTVRA
jgi:uncharacterized protein (TIGR00369 family)